MISPKANFETTGFGISADRKGGHKRGADVYEIIGRRSITLVQEWRREETSATVS